MKARERIEQIMTDWSAEERLKLSKIGDTDMRQMATWFKAILDYLDEQAEAKK